MKIKRILVAIMFAFIFIVSESTINPLIEKVETSSSIIEIPDISFDEIEDEDEIIEDATSNNSNPFYPLPIMPNQSISSSSEFMSSSSSSFLSSNSEYTKKVKVYINPSVQKANMYACSLGSEAENMQDIANLMEGILSNCSYIDLKINDGTKSLSNSCKESNEFKSDIHLALHSNAGGGKGSEIYYYKNKTFSNVIYKNYVTLNNFPQRGLKYGGSLYELSTVKAKYASLIELQFHDNEEEAKWIVNNKNRIALNLSNSIKEYSKKILNINY